VGAAEERIMLAAFLRTLNTGAAGPLNDSATRMTDSRASIAARCV
jgi:hypothetical protein